MLQTGFTPEAVAAAKVRLYDRMEQRKMDAEDQEIFSMMASRPFETPPVQEVPAEAVEEVREAPRGQGLIVAAWVVVELFRHLKADDWLFILSLVLAGVVMFGIRML